MTGAAGGGRHQVRVVPLNLPACSGSIASSLAFTPKPAERSDFADFFGNGVTAIAFREVHETLDIRMSARVAVSRPSRASTSRPTCAACRRKSPACWSLAPDAPHHFLSASDHAGLEPGDHRLCARQPAGDPSVIGIANDFVQSHLRRLRL